MSLPDFLAGRRGLKVRDEIRMIAPNLYLGRANLEQPKLLWPIVGSHQFVCWFALQFPE